MRLYKRALIIEDDFDLCLLLKAMLAPYVTEVQYLHSIKNCMEQLTTVQPDIVFIDNNLPDGKGIEAIKDIKASLPGVWVVLISAMSGLSKEAYNYGADVFIEKPLTESNVKNALEARLPDA